MSLRDKRVGFLGGGNMGEALVRGLTKTGAVPAEHLLVTDVRGDRLEELQRLYGIQTVSDNVSLVRRADVIISGLQAAASLNDESLRAPVHCLSQQDRSMKVRQAALESLKAIG